PEAMAGADERFYRQVVRAGYRGRYLATLAADVAGGTLDLEALADAGLDDDEVDRRLQALPGVGPYAACHVMILLGRYSRLVLDSWTRPKYARLTGQARVDDAAIVDRFARYGSWAGLAFWLFLTADWIDPT
ncbi:MAG: Fe-S cluster assembly protein HesB, partial [Actinomycetota bacterium]|nr:Fe-S cluster assembly protein HesB [Actinomycetota bacterium]